MCRVLFRFREFAAVSQVGQSEIGDLRLPFWGHYDIGALDIAVDDLVFVGFLKPLADADCERQGFFQLQRPGGNLVVEALAGNESHRDEGSAFDFIDLVDSADVWVIEARRSLRLAEETLFLVTIAEQMGAEELESNRTLELGVLGLVDDAHPALAEFGGDLVMGDGRANHDSPILP